VTSGAFSTSTSVVAQDVAGGGTCCGRSWVGDERSHCCLRTRGCGEVFDDVELFDAHRVVGCCVSPWVMGLVQTKNRIWLRVLGG
jgi:hypothetical protein